MAKDLSITVNGIKFQNPFLLGSGPPGTNGRVIAKGFDAGWGGAVAKTISLESDKVKNVSPRYGKLKSRKTGEVIGFENIELISDRPFEKWLVEFKEVKKAYPDNVLIASIMEEYDKGRWEEITKKVEDTGVDGFELNFSCPHGMPDRKMGSAIGEHPDLAEVVTGWVLAKCRALCVTGNTPYVARFAGVNGRIWPHAARTRTGGSPRMGAAVGLPETGVALWNSRITPSAAAALFRPPKLWPCAPATSASLRNICSRS